MVPAVSARCKHHHRRLECRRIIERADIHADQVRYVLRLVVERRAAIAAKSLSLRGPAVGSSRIFDDVAGDAHGGTGEHHDRGMSAAGISLAIPALTLEAAHRACGDLVADRAAGAAAGI